MPITSNATTSVKHIQTVAAATWTIVHGQGGYPIIDVYVPFEGGVQKVLPQSIVYIDGNTVEVQFSEARAGFATVIV